jgi:hypothetical protein
MVRRLVDRALRVVGLPPIVWVARSIRRDAVRRGDRDAVVELDGIVADLDAARRRRR